MRRVVLVGLISLWVTNAAAESISAAPAALTKVAILEIKSTGIDDIVTKNLSELFTGEAGRIPGYKVIGHQEIADLVGFEIQKQTLGCTEASCFAEIGGALGVDLIVSGSIGKVGETFVVSLRLIDNKRSETRNRVSESIAGRVELLPDYVRVAAWRLFGQPVPQDVTAAYENTKKRLDTSSEPTTVASAPAPAAAAPAATPAESSNAQGPAAAPAGPPPFSWWRVGRTVSGFLAVSGILYGAINHVAAWQSTKEDSPLADVAGFKGRDEGELKNRAYLGYVVGGVGIAAAITFSILDPAPGTLASRIVPTADGLAFSF